jgi:putative ATPase
MKALGHGEGYQYDHDQDEGFAATQLYWPDGLKPQTFYQPTKRGLEIQISEKLGHMRQLRKSKSP